MPDELLAGQDTPAASSEVTPQAAAPDTAAPTEATTQGAPEETKPAEAKSFTQDELNEIVRKEKAKAEAKAERRVLRTLEKVIPQPVQQPQQQYDDRPRRDQFASEEEFLDKLTDWKLDQREMGQRQRETQQKNQTIVQKTEKLYAEAEKLPGFDRETFDELPLTPVMAQALTDSDVAPKLMAHLAANPADVERIAGLSPARQAAEIGKLETKLSSAPAVKPPRAPAPIAPVGGGSAPLRTLASANNMSDFKEAMRKAGSRWVR